MSKTLKMILNHWTDIEDFKGEFGNLDLPFDIQSFCAEVDELIESLEAENVELKNLIRKMRTQNN